MPACRSRRCAARSAAWRSITASCRPSGCCAQGSRRPSSGCSSRRTHARARRRGPRLPRRGRFTRTPTATARAAGVHHTHSRDSDRRSLFSRSWPCPRRWSQPWPRTRRVRRITASPTSRATSAVRRCRRPGRRVPLRCSIGSPKPKPRFTTCRSTASTCTRSAPSTRSSTSSAPCSRWNGSAPTGSSRRRSTSAAAR